MLCYGQVILLKLKFNIDEVVLKIKESSLKTEQYKNKLSTVNRPLSMSLS